MSSTAEAEAPSWGELFSGSNALRTIALAGGVTLHAVNVYITTTILPSVVRDIGGLEYYAWNTTIFVVASILGSALLPKLIDRWGERAAYILALVVFSAGSIGCALAPSMGWMLAGRGVQGLGGGILFALSYTLIRLVFEERLWARALAFVSGMWGIASLGGPAVGGIFAQLGNWRLAFWSLLPCAAALVWIVGEQLPARLSSPSASTKVPIGKIALLAASALVISVASLSKSIGWSAAGIAAGLAIGVLIARLDRRATSARLLPTGSYSLETPLGALFACMSLLVVGITTEIFVPYFLQEIHGATPLVAGYLTAIMSGGWTIAALISSGRSGGSADRMIRLGPLIVAAALGSLAIVVPARGWLPAAGMTSLLCALLAGVGFGIGLAWPHLLSRVLSSAPPGEENLAGSSITTVQLYAMAIGAAAAGLVANAAGLSDSDNVAGAIAAARWVFWSFAAAPLIAAWLAARVVRGSDRIPQNLPTGFGPDRQL